MVQGSANLLPRDLLAHVVQSVQVADESMIYLIINLLIET